MDKFRAPSIDADGARSRRVVVGVVVVGVVVVNVVGDGIVIEKTWA